MTISAPTSDEAWNSRTDSSEITWSSLLVVEVTNQLALPKTTKLVRDSLDYTPALRGGLKGRVTHKAPDITKDSSYTWNTMVLLSA